MPDSAQRSQDATPHDRGVDLRGEPVHPACVRRRPQQLRDANDPPHGPHQHPTPPEPIHLTVEQSYTEVEELSWLGAVYDQDTDNLLAQQQGLKTNRKGITLGNYQEVRIRRVHQTLDEYLS